MENLHKKITREIKRIAWRMNYYYRKDLIVRPLTIDMTSNYSIEEHVTTNLYIQDLLSKLDNERERYIFKKYYLFDVPTIELAKELDISVQAVNKWKRKSLKKLKLIELSN